MNTVTSHAPGKIMIAGEWSITIPGNWCIVAAIDQYIHATISPSDNYCIAVEEMNIPFTIHLHQNPLVILSGPDTNSKKMIFLLQSLIVMAQYCMSWVLSSSHFN